MEKDSQTVSGRKKEEICVFLEKEDTLKMIKRIGNGVNSHKKGEKNEL